MLGIAVAVRAILEKLHGGRIASTGGLEARAPASSRFA